MRWFLASCANEDAQVPPKCVVTLNADEHGTLLPEIGLSVLTWQRPGRCITTPRALGAELAADERRRAP